MKALSCDVILMGASTRADGSLGLRLCTPELQPQEKTAIFEVQGKNLRMLLQPLDETPDELVTVKQDLDSKTPSQRLRAVLFVWWKQMGEAGKAEGKSFEQFYVERLESIIEHIKTKLEAQ